MPYDPAPIVATIARQKRLRELRARAAAAVAVSRTVAPGISFPTAEANAAATRLRADLAERLTRRLAFGATVLPVGSHDGKGGLHVAIVKAEPMTGKDPRTVLLSIDARGDLRSGGRAITLSMAIREVGGSVRG